ncbi:cytochrome P450 [Crucibulum laeve]|uniref:Cytochrome P450 n=1 Tax=Crucibulum laeve TaxID=68775 RepID=A0A5C3M9M8_9AGAR|nr:cytochrome P450 [Crucibulum laeve]
MEVVDDLLDKRSAIYSSRPRLPMLMELMKYDFIMGLFPFNSRWRQHRTMLQKHFYGPVLTKYHPIEIHETRTFLLRLQESPNHFIKHIHVFVAAIMISLLYGIEVKDEGNPILKAADGALQGFREAGLPGRFLVDLIPWLKYIPSWFPGARFKRLAKKWRAAGRFLVEQPWQVVKQRMEDGTASPCLATEIIETCSDDEQHHRPEEVDIAKSTWAAVYLAAHEIESGIQIFFLAMSMYPEVLKKAQDEIDAQVGNDRLPDFSDRALLPYVNAVIKETLRWQPITPLAAGHMLTQDDVYNGYLIPKDSIVLGNVWSILHDPDMYPDPEIFNPERFLKDGDINPDIRDPTAAAFGFGRRTCPGRFLADECLYILIVSIMAVYNIKSPINNAGDPPLKPEMTSGIISFPSPFKCIIEPRSSSAVSLIQDLSQ